MCNSLNRDIEIGEIVIIDPDIVDPEFAEDTRFKVIGGFGMKVYLTGSAIIGVWMSDNTSERYEGYEIEPYLTNQYQERFGKFGELDPRTPILPKVE